MVIREKDLKDLKLFIDIVLEVLHSTEKMKYGRKLFRYDKDQRVDVYAKIAEVKRMSGYSFGEFFRNFI